MLLLFGLAEAWLPATGPCASSFQAPLSGLSTEPTTMASERGLDAEFHDPKRENLLEALKSALDVDAIQSPTAWACL